MQGKPPPNQAAQGPQSSPGTTPPPPQTTLPPGIDAEPAGLRGIAPPAGADMKPRGRGGAGAQLSDVRWGMIFKTGWRLMSFFKVLVIGYAVVTLLQNVVTLGSQQLVGEVTNAIRSTAGGAPAAAESTTASQVPAISPATAPTNSAAGPAPETKRRNPVLLVVLWAIVALVALAVRLPLRAVATKLDVETGHRVADVPRAPQTLTDRKDVLVGREQICGCFPDSEAVTRHVLFSRLVVHAIQ